MILPLQNFPASKFCLFHEILPEHLSNVCFVFICPSRFIATQMVIDLWTMSSSHLCLLTVLFRQISLDRFRFTPKVCIEIAWWLLVIAVWSFILEFQLRAHVRTDTAKMLCVFNTTSQRRFTKQATMLPMTPRASACFLNSHSGLFALQTSMCRSGD